MTANLDASDCDVAGKHWMYFPHRRIDDGDAFDQDIAAAIRLDELGSQIAATKLPLFYRHTFFRQLLQPTAVSARAWRSFLPPVIRPPHPRPPMFVVALAVERALSRYRDVGLI